MNTTNSSSNHGKPGARLHHPRTGSAAGSRGDVVHLLATAGCKVLQKVTWGESAGIWQLCDRVLKSLALPSSQSQALPCILSPEIRAEEGKGGNELINRNELFDRGRASTHPWLAVTPGCLCNLHALCWLQPACLSSVPPALPSPWDLATRPLLGGDGATGCQPNDGMSTK